MKTTTAETPFDEGESARLTVIGAVPPELAQQLRSVPEPRLPELCRLPRPGERDPITSSSRSWLIDTDARLPAGERFLFRVRQRGKIRGAVFINVAKLRAFLKKSEAADHAHSQEDQQLVPA